ncbi:MAG: tetratricopeptide repeat protein, partial [Actinobacteria bacterium]|nr:tetratricopeptide repeat protein [Actinomycetota bacterium]
MPEPRTGYRAGIVPPLADGFSARPETGPGTPAAILPPGQALVLADPVPPRGRPGSVPGGTGKTQLAVYLAESLWQARQIALLIWVIAATRASVQFGFAQAFTELTGAQPAGDAEEAAHRFLAWLARAGRPWLVVLDDLADPAALAGLWPDGLDGRVVVTARHPGTAADRPGATVFPVGGFSSRESLSYLMGRLSADPDQRLGAVDLADELQGEPLALAQASATIASSDLTCRDYRDLFRQRREQIAEPGTAGPGARAVTWTLSAEHASQLAPGRQAQPCLALAALLDPHGIPGAVFTTAAAGEYIAPGTAVPGGPRPAQAVLVSLERSGLLTIDPASEARTIRVHPATSAAVLDAVPDSMREQAAAAAARALLEAWPADAGDPWLADAFRSCAGRLAAAAGGVLWTGGYQALLFRHGRSLDQARLTRAAIDHWRELAAASEQALGPGHPDPVTASDRLASAMLAGGLGPEAVELYQRAVAARTRAAGPDHPATLAARADLGSALLTAGRYGDAIDVLADVLQARARILGPDDPGTLKTTDDLVAAYLAAGRYPEA